MNWPVEVPGAESKGSGGVSPPTDIRAAIAHVAADVVQEKEIIFDGKAADPTIPVDMDLP